MRLTRFWGSGAVVLALGLVAGGPAARADAGPTTEAADVSGPATTAPMNTAPATTAPATTAPAVGASAADGPKGALKALSAAMRDGDADRIRAILQSDSELGNEMIESTVTLAEASAQLRRAAIDHFGEEAARDLIGDTSVSDEVKRIDGGIENVTGDKGSVQLGLDAPIQLVRINHEWRVPVMSLATGIAPAVLRARLNQQMALVMVLRQMATDVTAGHFQSAAEARQSLSKQVMAIVEEEEGATTESATQPGDAMPTTEPAKESSR